MRGIQPTWYQYADRSSSAAKAGGTSVHRLPCRLHHGRLDALRGLEDGDTTAWAARVNYAAKISNFNAINMGQISDRVCRQRFLALQHV